MGSFAGNVAVGTGMSRGARVGITCESPPNDVPVVRCSWHDLPLSPVRGAVR